MHSLMNAVYEIDTVIPSICLPVCLSVCPWHSGIVSKWLIMSPRFSRHQTAVHCPHQSSFLTLTTSLSWNLDGVIPSRDLKYRSGMKILRCFSNFPVSPPWAIMRILRLNRLRTSYSPDDVNCSALSWKRARWCFLTSWLKFVRTSIRSPKLCRLDPN